MATTEGLRRNEAPEITMIRLVQLERNGSRRVGVIEEPQVRLLGDFQSVYALATAALDTGIPIAHLIRKHASNDALDYDSIYQGTSEWRLRVPMDHPGEPARCLVSGTG